MRRNQLEDSLSNAVEFVTGRLGFVPDPKQEVLLRGRIRRGLLNCSRQWGKSTVAAAMAVHRAYSKPESLVVVLSPTARQSAEFLRKAGGFARKLGIRPRGMEITKFRSNFRAGRGLWGCRATRIRCEGFRR